MAVPISPEAISLIVALYSYGKVLVAGGAVVIGGWRVVQWVKEIRTKDVAELRTSVTSVQASVDALGHKVDTQTKAVVNELRELRSDFRTFYTQPVPQMLPAQSKPKRTRLKPQAVAKAEAA